MHLRQYVIEDDVNLAIRVVLESFIETQKFTVARQMRKTFSKYLFLQTGQQRAASVPSQTTHQGTFYLRNRFGEIKDEQSIEIPENDLLEKARRISITSCKVHFFLLSYQ